MKYLIISLSLAAGFMALSTMESSAIVCAAASRMQAASPQAGPWPSDVPSPVLPSSRQGG